MQNEYQRLKELVFPIDNEELQQFAQEFEQLEDIEKIGALNDNQEDLESYINKLEKQVMPTDHINHYIGLIKDFAGMIGYTELPELIEAKQWQSVIDEIEREYDEENEEFVDYCQMLIKQQLLEQHLSAMKDTMQNMKDFQSLILKMM